MTACDSFLYLGGNEQSTHKYVSELLGKETIDMNTYGKSSGRNGNYSTNYQLTGRELMTPDEVRRLDNRYALLFIRGENPVIDLKYDILKHTNISLTADGKGKMYEYGISSEAICEIAVYNSNHGIDGSDDESYIKVQEDCLEESAIYEVITNHELENDLERKYETED